MFKKGLGGDMGNVWGDGLYCGMWVPGFYLGAFSNLHEKKITCLFERISLSIMGKMLKLLYPLHEIMVMLGIG